MTHTVDDLTPYMQHVLEEAFQARERRQMSREDFAAGFIAALATLRSKSSFKAGRWDPEE